MMINIISFKMDKISFFDRLIIEFDILLQDKLIKKWEMMLILIVNILNVFYILKNLHFIILI
jgi:hypothetical protein